MFGAINNINTIAFIVKYLKRSAGSGKPLPSSVAMVGGGNHVESA
jgi:hypothetical protein